MTHSRIHRHPLLTGALLFLMASTAAASDTACRADAPGIPPPPERPAGAQGPETVIVNADRLRSTPDGKVIFEGKVDVLHGARRLLADRAVYDRKQNTIVLDGNARLQTDTGDQFRSPRVELDLDTDTGQTGEADFHIEVNHGRGHAERLVFEGKGRLRLVRVRFTTCRPEREDWHLGIRDLSLDQATDTGTARHAVLRMKGVPLFYTPYLSFPLSESRHSGFLVPDFGVTDKVGTYFTLPYYFNLAPNYDATLRPRLMSRRGVQTQSEFRYLGEQYSGQAEVEILPNDPVSGTDRWGATVRHLHRFSPNLDGAVEYQAVSDAEYFDDFTSNLSAVSQTHLPQRVQLNFRRDAWSATGLASRYQSVDKNLAVDDFPYARMPEIGVSFRPPERANRAHLQFDGSVVAFQHESSAKERATRVTAHPSLSYPMRRDHGFAIPRLSVIHTGYHNRQPGADAALSTAVGSIDAGLYFDRPVATRNGRWTQTLEPRAYYLYSPYQHQDALPVFDTSLPDFSFATLFEENRFIGGDRVGDANQLTLALTTRVLDPAGAQRFSASLGQAMYFDNRQVNLDPVGSVQPDARSEIAGELTAWPGSRWFWRGSALWDPAAGAVSRHNEYLQYQPRDDAIVTVGYRLDRGVDEIADLSAQWPLTRRWTLLGRTQYSLMTQRNQDSYLGVRYDACCWSLQTVVRRRLDQDSAEIGAVAIQLVFKGLAGIETAGIPDAPLTQSVLGAGR